MLRRLKERGADPETLREFYMMHVRQVLELAVPLWHSGLTLTDTIKIERVQKMAFAIILGSDYTSYIVAQSILECDTLDARREMLCLKFAQKCTENPKHSDLFPKHSSNIITRNRKTFVEPNCRTNRFAKSAVPYLTKLLNETSSK